MRDPTDVIVGFHSRAEVIYDQDGRSAVEQTIRDNNANWFSLVSPLTGSNTSRLSLLRSFRRLQNCLKRARPQERSAAATETSIYEISACSKTIIIRLH
jgi:hypothetical protein